MKVICVDTDSEIVSGPNESYVRLIEGNTYAVIKASEYKGDTFYQLQECNEYDYYDSEFFIPLSTIDETEFKREYNTITA